VYISLMHHKSLNIIYYTYVDSVVYHAFMRHIIVILYQLLRWPKISSRSHIMSVVNLIRHCYQMASTVVVCVFKLAYIHGMPNCQTNIGIYKNSFCQAYLCFFSYACTLFISSLDIKKDNKNILCSFCVYFQIQRKKYDQQYIFKKKPINIFNIYYICKVEISVEV